ncbi:MAG: type II secretion system major pseudopilin GspG [Woeseia sp.]
MRLRSTVLILVTVVLFGIVAANLAQTVTDGDRDNPVAKAKAEIRAIGSALKLYRLDNMRFASTEQGLIALAHRPNDPHLTTWPEGGYLARLPKDPWGRDYHYANPGRYGEIDIFTLGRDGRVGGEGLDATIGNWNL